MNKGQELRWSYEGLARRWAEVHLGFVFAMLIAAIIIMAMGKPPTVYWVAGVCILSGIMLSSAQRQALRRYAPFAAKFARVTLWSMLGLGACQITIMFCEGYYEPLGWVLGIVFMLLLSILPAYGQARILQREGLDGMRWILSHNMGLVLAFLITALVSLVAFSLVWGDLVYLFEFKRLPTREFQGFGVFVVLGMFLSPVLLFFTIYGAITGYMLERILADKLGPLGDEGYTSPWSAGFIVTVVVGLWLSIAGLVFGVQIVS